MSMVAAFAAGALVVGSLVVAAAWSARPVHMCRVDHVAHRAGGPDHVGVWEVCRCGRTRMTGDTRWRRRRRMVLSSF